MLLLKFARITISHRHQTCTRILFESLRRPFSATGSSPIFGRINLASFIMVAISSSPSFRIFQFLSPIFDIRSEVILSLKKQKNTLNILLKDHLQFMCRFKAPFYLMSPRGSRSMTSPAESSSWSSASSPSTPPAPPLDEPLVEAGGVCPFIYQF